MFCVFKCDIKSQPRKAWAFVDTQLRRKRALTSVAEQRVNEGPRLPWLRFYIAFYASKYRFSFAALLRSKPKFLHAPCLLSPSSPSSPVKLSAVSASSLSVSVRVPATSANLGPGFDALGLALDLFNSLSLCACDADSLEASGEGADELGGAATTIAHDAAHRVLRALGCDVAGVHLRMENQIPLARGLGSSSAAIVGGMVAANEWARRAHGKALSARELLEMATFIEGHPDNVAPALMGGLVSAACEPTGDGLTVAAVRVPVKAWPQFAVWVPDARLSTNRARGVLAPEVSRADAIYNLSRAALLVAALAAGDFEALGEALKDRLHQAQRAPLVPGFDAIIGAATVAGAVGATLSGAGPTILAWSAPDADAEAVRDAMQTAALGNGVAGRAILLGVTPRGAMVA